MTFSVHQHWDPLKVCIVGRSYPPEFYSWIKVPHVRSLFEKIAIETEEDFQSIIKKLREFGVKVLRPDLPQQPFQHGKFIKPPMTPRDQMVMIGNKLYETEAAFKLESYNIIKDSSWPNCISWSEFNKLPSYIVNECTDIHKFSQPHTYHNEYDKIFEYVNLQGNTVHYAERKACINGAMCARIGKDLYFGTDRPNADLHGLKALFNKNFPDYRIHIVDTGGHADATYCPVAPGLIISLEDVPTYANTFPGWEVVYLPGQSWDMIKPFLDLKRKNKGKWWVPGFEYDNEVIETVETWLDHWVGYVEETVFDVNMLIIDPKNVIVFNHNQKVFNALERYGITPHIVPFRHRYFWDGGIHCLTTDLHREGTMQDYFPHRS